MLGACMGHSDTASARHIKMRFLVAAAFFKGCDFTGEVLVLFQSRIIVGNPLLDLLVFAVAIFEFKDFVIAQDGVADQVILLGVASLSIKSKRPSRIIRGGSFAVEYPMIGGGEPETSLRHWHGNRIAGPAVLSNRKLVVAPCHETQESIDKRYRVFRPNPLSVQVDMNGSRIIPRLRQQDKFVAFKLDDGFLGRPRDLIIHANV